MRVGLVTLSIAVAVSATAATVRNGDFETVRDSELVGWQAEGPGGARVHGMPVWTRYAVTFNSAEYRALRPYLRIQSGTGTVWYDDVAISDLPLVNPSFEEGDASNLAGWAQDALGEMTFRDETVAVEGHASARLTAPEPAMVRIWQDVPCEPQTEYEFSFYARPEDLDGTAYAEVYGLTPEGDYDQVIAMTESFLSLPVAQFGRHVCELSVSEPGEAGITQRVSLSPRDRQRSWAVSAQVYVGALENGSVSLTVRTGREGRPAISETITEPSRAWQELSLTFIPGDEEIEVSLRAEGDSALVFVDNVALGDPKIVPPPRALELLPVGESFPIPEVLPLGIQGKVPGIVSSAIRLFSESLKERTGGAVLAQDPLRDDEPGVQLVVAPEDRMKRDPESYSLRVTPDRITIVGGDERGAMYGLMTLLELVQESPQGGHVFLAANIDDAPDMPFRASYVAGGALDGRVRGLIDQFARLKLNTAVFESNVFYHLDDPERRQQAEELFAYCRDVGIEPIPELQSFGWAHDLLAIDPNIAEGTEVVDESITLRGTEPVALAHPNVIRTEKSNITIADEDHEETFEEGRDYEVLPGEMAHVFKKDAAPFEVRRTPDSRIPDGATVLVNYDYVSRVENGNVPYCPNEPRVYEIMRQALKNTIRYLRPKHVHIGHDEPGQMGTDSRCRNAGRSNAENFAHDVWRLWHIAKAEDPDVRLMMWADAINPYHNGYIHADPTAPAADMLPRDIIQCIWFYGPGDPPGLGWESLEFFGERGYTMTGSPWYDPVCARRWSIVCKRAMDQDLPCIGVFYTSWADRWEALEEMAGTSWRVPEQ